MCKRLFSECEFCYNPALVTHDLTAVWNTIKKLFPLEDNGGAILYINDINDIELFSIPFFIVVEAELRTHVYASPKWSIIGSDNVLLPVRAKLYINQIWIENTTLIQENLFGCVVCIMMVISSWSQYVET